MALIPSYLALFAPMWALFSAILPLLAAMLVLFCHTFAATWVIFGAVLLLFAAMTRSGRPDQAARSGQARPGQARSGWASSHLTLPGLPVTSRTGAAWEPLARVALLGLLAVRP